MANGAFSRRHGRSLSNRSINYRLQVENCAGGCGGHRDEDLSYFVLVSGVQAAVIARLGNREHVNYVDAEEVGGSLFEIRRGDPFDYSPLLHLPVAVQNQTIAL